MKIWLVEDQDDARKQLASLLFTEFHDVDAFPLAEPALEARRAAHHRPDVIMTDLRLLPFDDFSERLDGLGFIRELRSQADATPILLYTSGDYCDSERAEAPDAGADDFMNAPRERPAELLGSGTPSGTHSQSVCLRLGVKQQTLWRVDDGSIGRQAAGRQFCVRHAAPLLCGVMVACASRDQAEVVGSSSNHLVVPNVQVSTQSGTETGIADAAAFVDTAADAGPRIFCCSHNSPAYSCDGTDAAARENWPCEAGQTCGSAPSYGEPAAIQCCKPGTANCQCGVEITGVPCPQ